MPLLLCLYSWLITVDIFGIFLGLRGGWLGYIVSKLFWICIFLYFFYLHKAPKSVNYMCGVDLILGVSFLCYHTGVKSVLVSLLAQKAEVKFDPAYLIPSQIANKIMELGYVATVMETETAGQNTIEIAVSTTILLRQDRNISNGICQ